MIATSHGFLKIIVDTQNEFEIHERNALEVLENQKYKPPVS